jgi:hypothetical protein
MRSVYSYCTVIETELSNGVWNLCDYATHWCVVEAIRCFEDDLTCSLSCFVKRLLRPRSDSKVENVTMSASHKLGSFQIRSKHRKIRTSTKTEKIMTNRKEQQRATAATNEIKLQEEQLRSTDADLQIEAELLPLDQNRSPNDIRETNPNNSNERLEPTDTNKETQPFVFVPLKMGGSGRTHTVSEGSRQLVLDEVSPEDLKAMTHSFYDKAFQDRTLDQFIRSHDDPHGDRFAYWIHQKLTGSTLWDDERRKRSGRPVTLAGGHRHVVHDRSSAHAAAWYSPKRPPEEVGRHFKLDECRVWMRLHFWAMRESGLMDKSPSFADYYVRFIGHFVSVYESSAPAFARDSLRWSESPKRIAKYLDNGRVMKDVLGLSFSQALAQLPEEEREDDVWPYNKTSPTN